MERKARTNPAQLRGLESKKKSGQRRDFFLDIPSSETASCLLGRRRYWGDSVSELFGFGLEAFDL
jgi:hypothetical protein